MADAISSSNVRGQGRLRFAHVAAAVALVFALTSLAYGQLALVAGALVCALVGLIAAGFQRDGYAAVGSMIAVAIAFTSPVGIATLSTIRADHAAAEQAENAVITSQIAEVDAFDAHVRAFQPDITSVDLHAAAYARITDLMKRDRDRLRLAALNSPDQSALLEQLNGLVALAEQQHSQTVATKTVMNDRYAAIPGKWAHIEALCSLPKVGADDACSRMRADYPSYTSRVTQTFAAVARDDAAYAAQQPQQRVILDSVR